MTQMEDVNTCRLQWTWYKRTLLHYTVYTEKYAKDTHLWKYDEGCMAQRKQEWPLYLARGGITAGNTQVENRHKMLQKIAFYH